MGRVERQDTVTNWKVPSLASNERGGRKRRAHGGRRLEGVGVSAERLLRLTKKGTRIEKVKGLLPSKGVSRTRGGKEEGIRQESSRREGFGPEESNRIQTFVRSIINQRKKVTFQRETKVGRDGLFSLDEDKERTEIRHRSKKEQDISWSSAVFIINSEEGPEFPTTSKGEK